jgi:outer membrane receptor protein involved in Fe transport
MRTTVKSLSLLSLAVVTWGHARPAAAQDPAPSSPVPSAAAAAAPGDADASPATSDLTIEQLAEQAESAAESEVIQVWAERPDKPFDRDTKLRLTGEQLAARGATDLGTALALLPDVTVREGGRGGFNIDIRGARKGSVRILIDGVSVSDPYYGTFDVSTIPITDIEQIRVSTAPSSPIDGPGGPGGVIEVHTRDAIGPQMVLARLVTDTGPSGSVAGSARVALSAHTALRLSGSGLVGARDFSLPMNAAIDESRRSATGASRFEYRRGERRVAVDAGIDDRHYVSPPSDEFSGSILLIDRETTARAQVAGDDAFGALQLSGRAWIDRLQRESRFFRDQTLADQTQSEDLRALRIGGSVLATRPIGHSARWAASATADRDTATVVSGDDRIASGDTTIVELAADVQLERSTLLVDGAVGVALPFGITADPWLEAKIDARYRPVIGLEIAAIAARKGRAPSLRERFDPVSGNSSLDPEIANHAELRLVARRWGGQLEISPYLRRTHGTVRIDPKLNKQINLGQLDVHGIDTDLKFAWRSLAEAGGSYSYITATSDITGSDPLDRLPAHRVDAWLSATPVPSVTALGRLRYFGRRIDQGQMLGAYTTVEASVTGKLSALYLMVLRVDDLLDKQPETRNGYRSEGRVVSLMLQGIWQ